jgi:hypothetical protein
MLVLVPMAVTLRIAAASSAGGVPAHAADVDEQRLVLAEEERQALGDRLLADAMPAVDVHQRGWRRVHRPAEDVWG